MSLVLRTSFIFSLIIHLIFRSLNLVTELLLCVNNFGIGDQHLKTIFPNSNIHVLTDADADYGSIFYSNGTNKYDVVILGHQEYETQREYVNLKRFVANGGTMVLMDGNVFYAQVKYNRNTHTITLVKGHGWAFNGKSNGFQI